jgi:hypothetical protein
MLMFSRSARLEGDATPSVRIKSTTAERLSRRSRLDVVGWRFIYGPIAKGRRTGNRVGIDQNRASVRLFL